MPNNTIKKPTRSRLANRELPGLGFLFSWDFETYESRPTQELRSLLAVHKLDFKISDLSPTSEIAKQVNRFKYSDGETTVKAKTINPGDNNGGLYLIGFYSIGSDGQLLEAKGNIDKAVYDLNSNTWLSQGHTFLSSRFGNRDSLQERIDKAILLCQGDYIRKSIIVPFLFSVGAISINKKGLYYIDAKHFRILETFSKFAETIKLSLMILEQKNTVKNKSQIAEKGKKEIHEKVNAIQEKLSDYMIRIESGKSIRFGDGVNNAKKELEELKKSATRLKNSLAANIDNLNSIFSNLDTEFKNLESKKPTESVISERILNRWRSALDDERFHIEDNGSVIGHNIPLDALSEFEIADSAKRKHSWNMAKPSTHLRALLQHGYKCQWFKSMLSITPLTNK